MSRSTTEARRVSILMCAMLAVLAVLLVPASQVCATDYHVDQSGNDSTGDGSLSTPWRTIRYALDQLSAGDTLYIHAGTYPAGGDSTDAYTIPTSGSSGNPITITNYQNDQVVISTAQEGFVLSDKDYITFDGLIVDNTSAGAVCIDAAGDHITIKDCELTNGYRAITCADTTQYTYLLVQDCTMHDLASIPVSLDNLDKVVIKGNTMYTSTTSISVGSISNLVVEDNFCYNTGKRFGEFKLFWGVNEPVDGDNCNGAIVRRNVFIDGERFLVSLSSANGCLLYHNVIANMAGNDNEDGMIWFDQASGAPEDKNENNVLKNNIIYHAGDDSASSGWVNVLLNFDAEISEDYDDQEIDYNCYYKDDGTQYIAYGSTYVYDEDVNGWYAGAYDNNSVAGQDPMLVMPSTDAGIEGFYVAAESPCIDAGTCLTFANGSGTGTTVTVDDARYFTDGFGLIDGDLIYIDDTTAQVVARDLTNNTITVDRSISWSNNDPITFAYNGTAPDIGVLESDYGTAANDAPTVDAGTYQSITLPTDSAWLDGTVSDDGLPASPGSVTTTWIKLSGYGTVTFDDANAVDTTATFSGVGLYTLRLLADDGDRPGFADVTVNVKRAGAGAPNEWHVDASSGSDSGEGTLSDPLRTLRYALKQLDAGDTLYIHAGTYPTSGEDNGTYELYNSGTSDNWITVRNYQNDNVYIRTNSSGFYTLDKQYIIFQGLDIACYLYKHCFIVGSHTKIKDCVLHDQTIAVKGNDTTQRHTDLLVEDCTIYSFKDIPIFIDNMDKVVIQNNEIRRAATALMDPGGITNMVIQDNYCVNTGKPKGALKIRWGNVEPDDGDNCNGAIVRRNVFCDGLKWVMLLASSNGAMVYNNVLFKEDGDADRGLLYIQNDSHDEIMNTNKNNVLKNNIFYFKADDEPGSGAYLNSLMCIQDSMEPDYDDQTFDHNLYYKSDGVEYIYFADHYIYKDEVQGWRGKYDYNSFVGDSAEFVDDTTAGGVTNFELTSDSICIDGGTPLTSAVGSGSGSTITVEDARYFTDGVGIIDGDEIMIGDSTTAVVTDRDIDNNQLTLDKSVSWSDGDQVTLAYLGNAPDIGAFEYDFGTGNTPADVNAGDDVEITITNVADLDGAISDDGLPSSPGAVTTTWTKTSGPGTVTFGDPSAVDTTAGFSEAGTYVLRLTAGDGQFATADHITIIVADVDGSFQEEGGTVVMETENHDTSERHSDPAAAAWDEQTSHSGYSGAGYMKAPSSGVGYWDTSSAMTYDIHFETAGTYSVWIRRYVESGVGNSAFVGLDGTISGTYFDNYNGYYDQWYWREHANTIYISAGLHTFNLRRREYSYCVDKIILGTDDAYSPSGTGPEQTARDSAPTVNAGSDDSITLPDSAVLDGTVSDDGEPTGTVTTTWSKTSGPGNVTFDDASAVDTTASFSVAGAYILRLTADDSDVLDYDEVSITVNAGTGGNNAPEVDAGSNDEVILPDEYATLDGTVSDDGLPDPPDSVTTTWSKQSGPGNVTFADASAVDTTAGFSAAGVYVLRLTANDGELTNYDEVTITARQNTAPTADAGSDDSVSPPNYATLDGTISDDGLPLSPGSVTTTWTKQSGPGTVTFGDSSAVDTTAGFSEAGTYVLRLTAHDGALSDYDEVAILASQQVAPDVNAGDDATITLPSYATLDGTVSDDGLPSTPGAVTTTWSKVSGPGTVTFGNSAAVDTTAGFSDSGVYVLRLTGDDGELTDYDNVTITVSHLAPIAGAGNDQEITLPSNATLDGTVSDDGFPLVPGTLTTTWSKISGAGTVTFGNASAADTTAGFSEAGTYVLRIMAYDGALSDDDTIQIIVHAEGTGGTGAFQEEGGTVVMETENYDDNDTLDDSYDWLLDTTTAGYVGDGYMTSQGSSAPYWVSNPAQLGYDVDFATAGTYYIWMRRWATYSGDNSCWIGLDGTQITNGGTNRFDNYNGYYEQWTWRTFSVGTYISTGEQTFNIRRREGNYRIDRIILTTASGYTPSGNGPAESSRGGGGETNLAPTVNAGSDDEITLPDYATLDGTVSDDGLPASPGVVTTTWSKTSGPGTVTFGDSSAVDTTAGFSEGGTYVLRLTAGDGSLTNHDDVTITVIPQNYAPTADAGSNVEITLPNNATLDGTVSDDGLPDPPATLTTTWSKISGPGTVTFGSSAAVDTTAGFSEAGTYVLKLEADDGTASDDDTVQVIVYEEGTSGTGAFEEEGGTVVMETENYDENTVRDDNSGQTWSKGTATAGYVGNGYMLAPGVSAEYWDDGCQLSYNIDFETAGTYYLWMRRYATDSSNNSCWVGLDGTIVGDGVTNRFDNYNGYYDQWYWRQHNTAVYISATSHTWNIRRREVGYKIDRIILTTDDQYTPSGTGPPESSRSGGNQAPTADAGSDDEITLPSYATLDGTVSDDGLPDPPASVTTTWAKQSGPGTVTFGDSSAIDTTATFSEAGTYVLRLTAYDGAFSDYDDVTITVNQQAAPTADAGSDDECTIPDSVSLDGTVSDDAMPDPPGSLTTTWTKQSGPGTVTFANASAVDTTAGFSDSGVYVLQLTADDGTATDSDTVQITVNHLAPTVDAGADDECTLPSGVTLDGTVSDDGYPLSPGSLTTTWTKQSGPGNVTFGDSSSVDTTVGFSEAGTYVLKLEASDGGLSDDDTVAIAVNAAASGTGAFQEEGGTVVMEAENYDENSVRDDLSGQIWYLQTSNTGYAGDGYMKAPDGSAEIWSDAAEASYEIDFETAGTYYVWMRRWCTSGTTNSAMVGIDGTQYTGNSGRFDNYNGYYDQWYWQDHTDGMYVSAGQHTFNLRRRERHYCVDRIILGQDSSYSPSGTGPAESSRE